MNHRIESKAEWAGFAQRARSASKDAVSACLAQIEQSAIQVLRDRKFVKVDAVEGWLSSRKAGVAPLVKEAEDSDNTYLDSLDALDGPMTPAVMRNFAIARALAALANVATLEPLSALLEAAYELSVVSDGENQQLLSSLEAVMNGSPRN